MGGSSSLVQPISWGTPPDGNSTAHSAADESVAEASSINVCAQQAVDGENRCFEKRVGLE